MNTEELIIRAYEARKNSYSPYSDFMVGAALLSKDGNIYQGCNVENAAYSPGNCAERTAFFNAVSHGEKDFTAIAIVGGKKGLETIDQNGRFCFSAYCAPCGVCRQVMREFCNPKDFTIILAKSVEDYCTYSLEDLLPLSFGNDMF